MGGVSAVFLAISPAIAADMPAPVYKAPVVAAPIYSWAGFYIGVNAGYTWAADSTVSNTGTDTGGGGLGSVLGFLIPTTMDLSPDGFIGGGQFGYNWQAGLWVYGIEADIQWADADDSFSTTMTFGAAGPTTTSASRELNWFGTLRARAGVTVTPTILAYVTGGLAVGQHKLTLSVTQATAVPPLASTATSSETSLGWTIGGGLEGVLFGNWRAKVEYLYFDLGDNSATIFYNYGVAAPLTSSLTARSNETGHIVRVGLNYRF